MTDRPLWENVSRFCYVTTNVLISTTFKCGLFVRLTNDSDYVVIVVLNMQLQPNFGTAQAYLAITCGFVS